MSRLLLLLIPGVLWVACRHKEPARETGDLAMLIKKMDPAHEAYYRGKIDSVIYLLDSVFPGPDKHPVVIVKRYELQYAIAFNVRKDIDHAVLYIDSAISYMEENKLTVRYPLQYFDILCRKGELELSRSNYNQSYQYYLVAKQWASLYLSDCEMGEFTYNLGIVMYRQQNYMKSRNYFRESMSLYAHCERGEVVINKRQELADNIGLCYYNTREYDSAMYYFRQALAILDANKASIQPRLLEIAQGVIFGNMAKVYVAQNKLDTAAGLLKKSVALNARFWHDLADAQLSQAQLADVYRKQERYAAMKEVLQQLKKGLDTVYNRPADLAWRRLMAAYYRNTGKAVAASDYYEAYISLRDSISDAERRFLKTDIIRQMEDKDQKMQITLLTKDNQLNRIYLIIAIALSVIAVLVILFVYYNFRKTARLNKLISLQKEELEQLNRVKNKMFSVVSHDMRSPVNSLTAFIHLLERGRVSQESLIDYSQTLKKKLDATSGMMENLLNWAASQLEGFRAYIERREIRTITDKAVAGVAGLAGEKQVNIDNRVGAEVMAAIDTDMLEVVVRNLLSNAVKYSYPGGTVVISAAVSAVGDQVMLQVQDEGTGMSPEYVETINSGSLLLLRSTGGTGQEKGTGLGIYLCQVFVQMMQGSLQAESIPGRGTLVVVALPA
ncbi:MAG: ATP-binding protein [Chitinophagaceae bacterium]